MAGVPGEEKEWKLDWQISIFIDDLLGAGRKVRFFLELQGGNMKKKSNITSMLIFLLALGLTACGDSGNNSGTDTSSDSKTVSSSSGTNTESWEYIQNIGQIDGTWTLSLNSTKDTKELLEEFIGKEIDAQTIAAIGNDMNAAYNVNISATVNASTEILDAVTKTTVSLSGTNAETFWPLFKAMFIEEGEYGNTEQFEVDDSKRSMTRTNTTEPLPINENVKGADMREIINSMQINSDGTKLKYISGKIENNEFSATIDRILMMFDAEEAIFVKK